MFSRRCPAVEIKTCVHNEEIWIELVFNTTGYVLMVFNYQSFCSSLLTHYVTHILRESFKVGRKYTKRPE